jgi:hypothetical protein
MVWDVIALIDGDSIAYQAGYSRSYIEMRVAVDNKMSQILADVMTSQYFLYLEEWREPKNIFRDDLYVLSNQFAKHEGYKGNRDKSPHKQPPYLHEARRYMLKRWRARPVKVYESEDVVIHEAYMLSISRIKEEGPLGPEPIVCFIDKDMLQHNLTYYNYNKRSFVRLTSEQAEFNTAAQVMSGDATDNIIGIPGIGPVGAKKWLDGAKEPLKHVAKAFKSYGYSYDYFTEQYNLVYIRPCRSTEVLYPITKEQWNDL